MESKYILCTKFHSVMHFFKGNSIENVTWLGNSIEDIYENLGPWQYHIPPVSVSKYHTVLYELPAVVGQSPKPHYNRQNDWDCDHVHMPFSPKNLFPCKDVSFNFLYFICVYNVSLIGKW